MKFVDPDIETLFADYCDLKSMDDSEDSSFVWTNFYNNIPKVDFIENVEEPDYNYDNYAFLSLKSYLSAWIHKNWDENIYITFPGRKKSKIPNKSYLIINPMIDGDNLIMNDNMIEELQTVVDNIPNFKSVLLYTDEQIILDSGILIPKQWIRELLPYVYINPELNPYVNELGLFVQMGNYPDFTELLQKLSYNLVNQLKTMYLNGYIYRPPSQIIKDWNLNTHNVHKDVYYPSWTDNRITYTSGGKYNFIFDRINGKKTIDYLVGNDNVVKHALSLLVSPSRSFHHIPEITYIDEYARIEVDNLVEAQKIASIIKYVDRVASGTVLIKYVTSMDDVKIYKEIGDVNQDVLKYDSIAVYKSSDIQKPYLVSFLFPYNLHINLRQTSELLWNVFQDYRLNEPIIDEIKGKDITPVYLENIIPYPEVVDDKLQVNLKYSDGIQYARNMTTLVPHHLTDAEMREQIIEREKENIRLQEELEEKIKRDDKGKDIESITEIIPEINNMITDKKPRNFPISISNRRIMP